MFSRPQQEKIWETGRKVSLQYPSTYDRLFGIKRLGVSHLLDEPIQSTLHQIIQRNVRPGTRCVYKRCPGYLNAHGKCSEDCEQMGINVVDDIIHCQNCDCFGFPCPTCHVAVFHRQLPMALEDY